VAAANSSVFLTVHGIDGDKSAGETEFGEQCLHCWDFVRLLVTVEMRQHQRRVGGKHAQNMRGLAVLEMIEAVAQRLAVDGDMALPRGSGLRVQNGSMATENVFHRNGIQLLEDEPDRAVGRRASPRQRERAAQPSEMNIDEAVDCPVRVGPGHHRQNGK
jgi:hypothetical protein